MSGDQPDAGRGAGRVAGWTIGPASPVGNVTAAHVCAGMPNFLILEHSFGEGPWRAELIDPPEALDKGHMVLTERPGLGITLNAKVVTKYRVE